MVYGSSVWVSLGVMVSALPYGWENLSLSSIDFELGNKCFLNLSDYNHASFPWDRFVILLNSLDYNYGSACNVTYNTLTQLAY